MGIGPGLTPSTQATGAVRTALAAAAKAGPKMVSRAVDHVNAYSRGRNNGWLISLGYIGDYGRNWLGRAVIARFALGANTAEETVYPSALTDSRGRPLRGNRRYRIRFARGKLPPADAFWSLTMYDTRRLPPSELAAPLRDRRPDAPDCAVAATGRSRSRSRARDPRARLRPTGSPPRAVASA